jgi:hypothetical protein
MGIQRKAVRVLDDLLAQDLPSASWSLYPEGPARLYGQVLHSGAETPEDIGLAHQEIEQWARFLGVDVVPHPYPSNETVQLWVEGTYEGVEIHMAAIVPDDGGAWEHRRQH